MGEQKSYINQMVDRLKKVRGHLTKKDDKDTILCAINLLHEMKVKLVVCANDAGRAPSPPYQH